MTTELDSYRHRLLIALRRHGVPGPRIGEAIAEVESHVAETGEDPVGAFGDPDAYAERLSRSLGLPARSRAGGARWTNAGTAVVAAVAFAAAGLTVSSLLSDGQPAERAVTAAVGLLAFAVLVGWLVRRERRASTRVIDPRTGTDVRFPAPRWALLTFAGAMAALVVIMLIAR